jgi:hypothetical protein
MYKHISCKYIILSIEMTCSFKNRKVCNVNPILSYRRKVQSLQSIACSALSPILSGHYTVVDSIIRMECKSLDENIHNNKRYDKCRNLFLFTNSQTYIDKQRTKQTNILYKWRAYHSYCSWDLSWISVSHEGQNPPFLGYCLPSWNILDNSNNVKSDF